MGAEGDIWVRMNEWKSRGDKGLGKRRGGGGVKQRDPQDRG